MTDDTSTTATTRDADATAEDGTATETDKSLLDSLTEHTIPLETTDPTAEFDDLTPLRDRFEDTRIVGLGEATHGTREFFRLKHRLLRYLVTELNVRVFGLEANFSEALMLNDYVVHGEGTAKAALESVYFWTWNVESVIEMVEWLRTFNAERPLDDRVRFYGFDSQYTQGAVDELVEFFETVDPEFLSTVREDLDRVADGGTPSHQDDHRIARIEAAERVVPKLRNRLIGNREAYVAELSESAWELSRQHVRIIKQATEHKRAMDDLQSDNGDEATAMERVMRVRDHAMANTVDWILEYEEADRAAIWGHDAHLNRIEHSHTRTDAAATSMGGHLADRHGDDYYALGFSFGRGAFQAVSEDTDSDDDEEAYSLREQVIDRPIPDTIDETLSELGRPLAAVDLRGASEDDQLADWLTEPRKHFSVGATYDPENPEKYLTEYAYGEAFDGVCYVDETLRARHIDRT